MAKEKRPTWFKINLANKDMFMDLTDEELGKIFKLALGYFEQGEVTDISNLDIKDRFLKLAFTPLKQACDEALEVYKAKVEGGKKGASIRWSEENREDKDSSKPPIAPL